MIEIPATIWEWEDHIVTLFRQEKEHDDIYDYIGDFSRQVDLFLYE